MKKVEINRENILNPEEAFKSYLSRLMPIYIEDYGVENSRLIKERINKAIYLFDSLPIDEINFIVEYGEKLQCKEKARLAFDECRDFINKKKKIEEKTEKKFYNILADVYGAGDRHVEELFTMEVDYYSLEMQLTLASDETNEELKDEIRKKQEEYRKTCERLGIKCITDHRIIDRLFEIRDDIDYETNLLLARETKFGKRLKKEIFRKSGAVLTDAQLVDLLFYSNTASTASIDVGRKNKLIVCYFPLAKNIMIGNVDSCFFHEMRHILETSDNFSGIQVYSCDKYLAMNELRTEKNAVHDLAKLKDFPLFSSDGFVNYNFNVYQKMFCYTEGFFDEHRKELNKLAIRNAVKEFERLYGKKSLREFEKYLKQIHTDYLNDTWMYKKLYDEEKQKSLVRSLNEHYQSRH